MSELPVRSRSQAPNPKNSYTRFQAPRLLTPRSPPGGEPPPPTSHRPLGSEPAQSREKPSARPGRQGDIKKRGGEEGEGAELKRIRSLHKPVPASRRDLGGGRRPTAGIEHHVTASRRVPPPAVPTAGPRRAGTLGSGGRSRIPEPGSRTILPRLKCQGDKPAPPPPHTGALAAPPARPAHPPHRGRAAPTPPPSPRPKPFGASSAVRGPGQPQRFAPSSAERTTEREEARGQPGR